MRQVSVEPLPKQGCENDYHANYKGDAPSLSGTPAEAGVRELSERSLNMEWYGLSGTPAEAGVRDGISHSNTYRSRRLSGTPAEAGVREVNVGLVA